MSNVEERQAEDELFIYIERVKEDLRRKRILLESYHTILTLFWRKVAKLVNKRRRNPDFPAHVRTSLKYCNGEFFGEIWHYVFVPNAPRLDRETKQFFFNIALASISIVRVKGVRDSLGIDESSPIFLKAQEIYNAGRAGVFGDDFCFDTIGPTGNRHAAPLDEIQSWYCINKEGERFVPFLVTIIRAYMENDDPQTEIAVMNTAFEARQRAENVPSNSSVGESLTL